MAGDWRKDGRGVRGWLALMDSMALLRCGRGVDGNKLFLMLMLPRGVLEAGDANERDLALYGEMRAGPRGDGLVGPTLEDDVSPKERYQGLRESKWCCTVKENLEEEHEPILAVDLIDEESKRSDEALGYDAKSLNSRDSSKSNDDTTIIAVDSSTNGRTPYKISSNKSKIEFLKR